MRKPQTKHARHKFTVFGTKNGINTHSIVQATGASEAVNLARRRWHDPHAQVRFVCGGSVDVVATMKPEKAFVCVDLGPQLSKALAEFAQERGISRDEVAQRIVSDGLAKLEHDASRLAQVLSVSYEEALARICREQFGEWKA